MTTTTIDTVAGPMVIDQDELQIGRFLDAEGKIPTHDDVVAFMRRHVKSGDSVVDVGANAGFFTLVLADIVGPEGSVTAFEPNREVIVNLWQTVRDRSLRHVFPVMEAIGRERGWVTLRFDPRGPGGTQVLPLDLDESQDGTLTRTIETLDDHPMIRRPVSFIKIDTEGMDVDVLLGAQKILEEDRPVVFFEWNPDAMRSLGKDPGQEFGKLWDVMEFLDYWLCDYRNDDPITFTTEPASGDYALLTDEGMA